MSVDLTTLDPLATAVVIVDVQVGVFETDPAPLDKEGVLARINHVTDSARAARAAVIFLQHDGDPEEQWLIPFTDAWRLHPALHVGSDDRVIRKTACDGFYRTELDDYLRGNAVKTLVIAGYATDFCVDTTIRSAASREYDVIVVADAHTTRDRPVLTAEQIKAHHQWLWSNLICPSGVSLMPAAEVARRLMAAR